MPLRSAKMKRFIFGFQRRVWWPQWTPASRSWFMVEAAPQNPPGRAPSARTERPWVPGVRILEPEPECSQCTSGQENRLDPVRAGESHREDQPLAAHAEPDRKAAQSDPTDDPTRPP